ncbi:aminoglycoside adenylyltransferase domain-containing protein [Guptibacillus hwajinpoensis]|uniref:aminoglycoside adenylyltransferase domain-containing protein n=1 Tax=Guptibacillus hwajinpoensis TaxID=208199 RepID=UPI001CFD64D5|nr:aminoglycoside adenylyltransferase domain-containing protein [Pseudalkalibacillus hwajinpoensis]
MSNWHNCSSEVAEFVKQLVLKTKKILGSHYIGFYLHGSLAVGGFNSKQSDLDFLVITKKGVTVQTKKELAQLYLSASSKPYPIEMSLLREKYLRIWEHPSSYDFHFSEFWRERYERDLKTNGSEYINAQVHKDPDLAAHITITTERGICIDGRPIERTFPKVPREHYISSILGDFEECVEGMASNPIYSILNTIRVYWYLKDGVISSKKEAGIWGLDSLPIELKFTVEKAIHCYLDGERPYEFNREELLPFTHYITKEVRAYLI